ncbi:unnamed protein product [Mesocestoides corti]|uniref:Uncharacterized protein n=1 Tax=Mesocestoides corti TaxID=53468 RepID=A0A0R3U320_MESCO|nr:unnamed protein product [Mesocestoides corti]
MRLRTTALFLIRVLTTPPGGPGLLVSLSGHHPTLTELGFFNRFWIFIAEPKLREGVAVMNRRFVQLGDDRSQIVSLKEALRNGGLLMQHRAGAADAASGSGSSGRRTPSVSWEAYRSWNLKDNDLYIGRKPSIKLQSNDIKLSVAMFTKLDEKILSSLPSGFPVRVDGNLTWQVEQDENQLLSGSLAVFSSDVGPPFHYCGLSDFLNTIGDVNVPVAPGITGRVTFKNIETCEANKTTSLGLVLQDELFKIPVGYISSEVL